MTKRIVITPRASQDLEENFAYIAQNNLDAALRFFDAARQTFARVGSNVGNGSPVSGAKSTVGGFAKVFS
ncbi:type II toxin-antitoxin system RelE/ParE family toxin [Microcoleus sp. herbarium8]|uniref:type II toxin-antitoxin system RelE/ParE family toxin n=1 Tax=Microcoleus sp. herbarium8 TaxID=3055436 RepID=UPI0034DF086C